MANCKHGKCRNKPICGQVVGTSAKNPGGNIYTPAWGGACEHPIVVSSFPTLNEG